jgi:uncharacterized protein (UPF0332 family)
MFDWNEYLVLARELRLKQSEAALRSSISRAYYAAFCTALYRLHPSGSGVFSRDSHASLWQEYRRQGRAFSHIGVRGDRIRKDRQAADYDLEVPGLEKVADKVLQEAESIVAYLRERPAR